jgi:GNAT superfamily N-acetyltransferase
MQQTPVIRPAQRSDLPAILGLLVDPESGPSREPVRAAPSEREADALAAILHDPNNEVYVAELGGEVVGTFQLTFITQLNHGGCQVAQLENVFVNAGVRSAGIGTAMLTWAAEEARRRGALRLQLTSNLKRLRAHQFYERFGFHATHKGMKLYLE